MRHPFLVVIGLAVAGLACGRGTAPLPTPLPPTEPPLPTAPLAVPTLPAEPPPVSDLQAFAAYAEEIKPIVEVGAEAAQRDGDIIEAAEEDESALCGGGLNPHPTLVGDAALMHDLEGQLGAISPPADVDGAVHEPLSDSVRLWAEALDKVNESCQTEGQAQRNVLRAGAVLQFWAAALNFRVASDNFWRLLIANGLEELAN